MGTYIVREDFLARTSDELTVKKGDIMIDGLPSGYGWIQGECRGKIGHVPASFLMEYKKDRTKPPRYLRRQSLINAMKNDRLKPRYPNSSRSSLVPPHRSFYPVKVLYQYTPVHRDELALKPNDVIHVIRLAEEGWYEGMLNGKRGLFPANYVTWNDVEEIPSMNDDELPSIQRSTNGTGETFNQLQNEISLIRSNLDGIKTNFTEQMGELARELDDERKARASLQIELERIQKVLQKHSQRLN